MLRKPRVVAMCTPLFDLAFTAHSHEIMLLPAYFHSVLIKKRPCLSRMLTSLSIKKVPFLHASPSVVLLRLFARKMFRILRNCFCAHTGVQEPHKKQIGLVVVPGKHFVKCELLAESEPTPESGSGAEEDCDDAPDLTVTGSAL